MNNRDLRTRYGQIGRVLVRHGFEWLWTEWGVGRVFGRLATFRDKEPRPARSQPEQLRLTLEELGTTAIKLGQILSTRPDLIPQDYIEELSRLQDHAPHVPYDDIAAVIERELGRPPDVAFQSFEREPRAVGSIAQVHAAQLADGTNVVVKVRRPGIEEQIEQDLVILGQIARFVPRDSKLGRMFDIDGMTDEFAHTIRNELDFIREGQNAERIANQFAEEDCLHVPTIYWDYSTSAVLTMEDINGIKISDLAALDAAGMDRHELAERCAHIAVVQVLYHGFFHADPHPGNFFVLPDGRIALLDYGMVGEISDRLRTSLVRLSLAVSREDTERIIDEMLALGACNAQVNRAALRRDIERLISSHKGLSLGSISAALVFRDISATAQRHSLALPSDLIMVARVVAMDEGLGASLDPDFKLVEFAKPYVQDYWNKSRSLQAVVERTKKGLTDLADLASDLPERLLRLSGQLERGEVTVTSRLELQDATMKQIQQGANRIAVSVLVAGIIVGLSVLTLVFRTPGSEGRGDLLLRALLACGVLSGAWLVLAIWRSNRSPK